MVVFTTWTLFLMIGINFAREIIKIATEYTIDVYARMPTKTNISSAIWKSMSSLVTRENISWIPVRMSVLIIGQLHPETTFLLTDVTSGYD